MSVQPIGPSDGPFFTSSRFRRFIVAPALVSRCSPPCSRSILHVHPLNESETDIASPGEMGKQGKHSRKAVQLPKKPDDGAVS